MLFLHFYSLKRYAEVEDQHFKLEIMRSQFRMITETQVSYQPGSWDDETMVLYLSFPEPPFGLWGLRAVNCATKADYEF